jgi:MFS family permease
MYGFTALSKYIGFIIICVGVFLFLIFAKWETRSKHPILNIDLFKTNRTYAFSNLAAFINYSATFAVTFLLSLYLQYIKGYTPQQAGLVLIAQPIIMSISSPFAGKLSDKFEPRILASLGMFITAIGLFLLIFITQSISILILIIELVILGLGFGFFSSPNTNAIMSSVDRRFYGIASGTVGTMRLTGQVMSMGISTLIFALMIGKVQINPENYILFLNSVKIIFAIFSVLSFGGVFASLARGNIR